MKRKLFFLERLLYGDGRAPFHAVLSVRISGSLSMENLCRALEKVQAKHPLLQSRIIHDEKGLPHFIADGRAPSIPVRITERGSEEDWIKESKREWIIPFDMEKGPLIRLVWLHSSSTSDLLMTFHHCICNGTSCVTLMQEILMLLDDPAREIGRYDHFITPEELLYANPSDKTIRRKARLKSLIMQAFLSCRAALIDKKKTTPLSREKDYLINWKLDEETSRAIFHYCKNLHVTVNTALCVAFLSAFRAVRGETNYTKITCPVDIRKYLPPAIRNDLFSFGLAIDVGMDDKGPGCFRDKAIKMQKEVTEKMDKLSLTEFLMPLEYAHPAFGTVMKVLKYGKRRTNLILSNMGRLEIKKEYASFRVETIYSPTVIGSFGDPTDIVTTTFNGQMDFCFLSNEEFLPYADAMAIKKRAMELLIPK